ncbi:MAG: TIGR03564 family F420-dependent LLM class oxidoreductase [Proteobacteria bacterium]|nr:TIGR03564 family F420-dependent LLM class oxidoreductase [Pseudomonadota bacterium]
MRIGAMLNYGSGATPASSLDPLVEEVRGLEARGLHTAWVPHVFGLDALSALTAVGRLTERIELGTSVVPTYPRHPAAMAQQALTVQIASGGGRFSLGIGLSHKPLIEDMFGLSFERPVRHMREYLEILAPALRGEPVDYRGEVFRYRGRLAFDTPPVPLLVAALGEQMLRLCGRLADGTVTWMVGIRTLENFTIPTLAASARTHDRPEPRIVAGMPVFLTHDLDATRERLAGLVERYGAMPSYRAMLEREGARGPEDIALIGDEPALRAGLARLRDIGVTDLMASLPSKRDPAYARTLDLLQSHL